MQTQKGEKPVLKNLIVEFGAFDASSNRSGAFLFLSTEEKVFLEFGLEVSYPEGRKLLPTFEYRVAKDSGVYAPCDGEVTALYYQEETEDYAIGIKSNSRSNYIVWIDHVKEQKVEREIR